ncbi:MAG TPA: zf-HC2 domain-containing protein [Trichormus sp.]
MSDPHADCNQIRPLLDAYHDNELDKGERAVVEAHLRICDACRRGLAGINFVVDSMGKLPAMTLKRDLSGAIESRLLAGAGNDTTVKTDAAAVESGCEMLPLLDAFYDRELGPSEHKEVVQHLAGCEQCRHAVTDIGRVVVSLKNMPTLRPRTDVAANFEKILAAKTKVVLLRKRVAWGSMAVAAAAAIVAFAMHIGPAGAPGAVTIGANQTAASKVEVATIPSGTPVQLSQESNQAQKGDAAQQSKVTTPSNAATVKAASTQKTDEHGANNVKGKTTPNASSQSSKPAAVRVAPPMVAENQQADKKQSVTPNDGEKIADAQVGSTKGETVVALYDSEANSAAELGITTDEDGLYAIKL